MLKETYLNKESNKLQIDNIFIEAAEHWLQNLSQKPELIEEIRSLILAEQGFGTDLKTILKKYIYH